MAEKPTQRPKFQQSGTSLIGVGSVLPPHGRQGELFLLIDDRPLRIRIQPQLYMWSSQDQQWMEVYSGEYLVSDWLPAAGLNLDTVVGPIDYVHAENAIGFQAAAVYPTDFVVFSQNVPFGWKEDTEWRFAILWAQADAAFPNWVLDYRFFYPGEVVGAITWTSLAPDVNVYTWTSGILMQLSLFPEVTFPSVLAEGGVVEYRLFRDTTNVQGLYPGADAYPGTAFLKNYTSRYTMEAPGLREGVLET